MAEWQNWNSKRYSSSNNGGNNESSLNKALYWIGIGAKVIATGAAVYCAYKVIKTAINTINNFESKMKEAGVTFDSYLEQAFGSPMKNANRDNKYNYTNYSYQNRSNDQKNNTERFNRIFKVKSSDIIDAEYEIH